MPMYACQICAVSFAVSRTRLPSDPAIDNTNGFNNTDQDRSSAFPTTSCTFLAEQSGCRDRQATRNDATYNDHISGPGCVYDQAYSGARISHDEMEGAEHPIHIVEKPTPEYGRANYEKNSSLFIPSDATLLEDGYGLMFINNDENDIFQPQISPCYGWGHDDAGIPVPAGIPVHDWCWKIFEKVSKLRLGAVDIQGFGALFFRDSCAGCGFQNMPHHPAIKQNSLYRREWLHIPGTEFLAANPEDIPGYLISIQQGYSKLAQEEDRNHLAQLQLQEYIPDAFQTLPFEIRQQILLQLSLTDILNLRTISRAFWAPNPTLSLHLIKRDFPWFSDAESSQIASLDETYHLKLQQYKDHKAAEKRERDLHSPMARTEDALPEMKKREVDWEGVYRQLYVAKREFKGLRNRVRIWEVVERIVQRIVDVRARVGEEFDEKFGLVLLPARPSKEEIEREGWTISDKCIRCKQIG